MTLRALSLPADPDEALTLLRDTSKSGPVILFKQSPICPISKAAETEFHAWRSARDARGDDGLTTVSWAVVDVIAERTLARGLTERLDIQHESPQALLFVEGTCTWHDSHSRLTRDRFSQLLDVQA